MGSGGKGGRGFQEEGPSFASAGGGRRSARPADAARSELSKGGFSSRLRTIWRWRRDFGEASV